MGRKEIISYLKTISGSPLLNGDAWDVSQFNISKIIYHEPFLGVSYLLDFEFKSSSNLIGSESLRPSFVKKGIFSSEDPSRNSYTHYKEMLVEMFGLASLTLGEREKIEANINKAIDNLRKYNEVISIDKL